jgi:hypothetical protein
VIVLYYACLYQLLDKMKEPKEMVLYATTYVVLDFMLILISFCGIKMVKKEAQGLIDNENFKEYK